ncbi:hypothetical protein M1105_16500 [Limibaculum sp. FT325]|uniref:hypothetical protein n=1 Tax=Thermohalobaculum sediminis TaxID=2939436 RepID=UPI0020BF93BC|nr:hypothetical protein [Limibaculum sediminis]MCL5778580.1 hypothetical protein [Limibaculum sediminis]
MPHKWPAYPAILTDAAWQKKKGAIAKIAGKTGVGDAMKAADKAYSDVLKNRTQMNLAERLPHADKLKREDIDATLKQVVAYYNANVEGDVRKKIIALRDAAKKTAEKWEKNKLIPKDSAKYAREVEKAADFFMVSINKNTVLPSFQADYNQAVDDFDKHAKFIAENAKRLKHYVTEVAKGLRSIKTTTEFKKFWSEDIRGVGTALPPLAKELDIVNEWKAWRKFTTNDFMPTSDDEIGDRMSQIAPVLKKIAAAIK